MAWAEHPFEVHQQSQSGTWFEHRLLGSAHPAHFLLAVLWMLDWLWITGSSARALLRHVCGWTHREVRRQQEPVSTNTDFEV